MGKTMTVKEFVDQNRNRIREKIAGGRIEEETEYLDEYKTWIERFNAGHSISQITEHTEAVEATVREVLYAMDLYPMAHEHNFDVWSDLYYSAVEVSHEDIRDFHEDLEGEYIHERSIARIVRAPAHRMLIEDLGIEVEAVGSRQMRGLPLKRKQREQRQKSKRTMSDIARMACLMEQMTF